MSDQYRLVGLGNSELLAGLSALVRQGNMLTATLLAHLVEIEERLLHLELGFSSLFSYCVEALGMSEGAAGRRVTAARVCRRFPEAFERIARGDLHLCALCTLAPHLTRETTSELFDACRAKSRRQIEALLAARFPRPDVREQIRRLPARAQTTTVTAQALPPSQPAAAATVGEVQQVPTIPAAVGSAHWSAAPSAESTSVPALNRPRRTRGVEPLSADRFGVHFTADAEPRELIERARALASHRIPNGDLASLMKLMVANFVQREEQRRFGVGTRARRTKAKARATNVSTVDTTPTSYRTPLGGDSDASEAGPEMSTESAGRHGKHGRYLSASVRQEVHDRDRGRCAFVSADGRRCNARVFLQFDHVKPFAKQGGADAPNIRLLCRAHNLLHARHCFGKRHLATKIAASRAISRAGQPYASATRDSLGLRNASRRAVNSA